MNKLAFFPFDRIFVIVHFADGFLLYNFQIGNCGHEFRIPVNQFFGLVNQTVLIKADKDFAHRPREAFVHGEACPRPVAGSAQTPQLLANGAAVLFLPFPHALKELLAAEVVAGQALLGAKLLLDLDLGGDAGVVHAGLPQNVFAEHAVIADKDILQSVVQRMPHVQNAGDVRRRNDDGKGFLVFVHVRFEIAGGFPLGINFFFKVFRIVSLV